MRPRVIGFIQAVGVALYCALIGLLMGSGNTIFGNLGLPYGPILILLLFSVSALVCAAIVFYKPYRFFIAGKKKEASDAVVATALWLSGFVVVFLTIMAIFK